MDGLWTLILSILQYAMCTYSVLFTPRTNNKPPAPGLVIEHAFWMKKGGYKPSTIERRAKILKVISRQADLKDGEAVKRAIAEMNWLEGTKELVCGACALLARSLGFA